MIKIKLKKVLTACLVMALMFSLAACGEDSKEKESSKAISNTAKATADSTEKPINTGKPAPTTDEPIITDPTGNVSTTKPVEPTVKPTNKPTATPTKVPTKEPTKVPTEKPTPEPTKDPQPTADPNLNLDEWGVSIDNHNTIRKKGKYFIWTKTRHIAEIPKELENMMWGDWIIDGENEQLVFGKYSQEDDKLEGIYTLRDGKFYKLNKNKVIMKYVYLGYCVWIEEDGTVCSIGQRTKRLNEVYIEGTDCEKFDIGTDHYTIICIKKTGETVSANTEDILREVQQIK